jgi:hypothetical protein
LRWASRPLRPHSSLAIKVMFWQGFFTGLGVGAIIFGVWVALIVKQQLALEAALGSLLHEALQTLNEILESQVTENKEVVEAEQDSL